MGFPPCVTYHDIPKMAAHPHKEILGILVNNGFQQFSLIWQNVHDTQLIEKEDIKLHLHHEHKCEI